MRMQHSCLAKTCDGKVCAISGNHGLDLDDIDPVIQGRDRSQRCYSRVKRPSRPRTESGAIHTW